MADRWLTLRVALSAHFPEELPHIYLLRDSDEFIPHVQPPEDWICYKTADNLSVRLHSYFEVVAEAVELSLEVLANGLGGLQPGEVVEEIEAFAREYSLTNSIISTIEPSDEPKPVLVFFRDNRIIGVTDANDSKQGWTEHAKHRRAVYLPVPLNVCEELTDPRQLASAQFLRQLIKHHSPSRRARVKKLLKSRPFPFVVLAFPRSNSHISHVAVKFPTANSNPLYDHKVAADGKLVSLNRLDCSTQMIRGGALPSLRSRHVLVVGCGAVGGHLTLSLARAGVGKLTLVDHDTLQPENAYRHVLGMPYWSKFKTDGLCDYLRLFVPQIAVASIPSKVSQALDRGDVCLDDVDLVVVAVGSPTTSRLLNTRLRKAQVASVHTWLEPLGLGGHAILTHPSSRGCLECLFTNDDGECLHARSDFAAPDQQFTRDLTGCGDNFTPYGDLDAQRTGVLATQLVVDVLTKRTICAELRSWKGSSANFEQLGFKVSQRFALGGAQLTVPAPRLVAPRCPCCGGQ